MGSVTIDSIRKTYGDTVAVDDLSLHIEDGEFFSLLGPSGCGKSTLLHIVAGLIDPDRGCIRIDGHDATTLAPRDREIAMVFQDYALYPHMTVFENLAFPLKARRGLTRRVIKSKVEGVLELLDIAHLAERIPRQLSGGQRQRVAVGRALVREPKAFLMDEPLSNLDARLRVQMRRELQDLHQRLNATIIYVTHDQAEAMAVSDRIAVLSNGVLQQVGPPKEIYDQPSKRFVANFLGIVPMTQIEGVLDIGEDAMTLVSADLRYPLPARYRLLDGTLIDGQPVCLGIHPEHVQVFDEPGPDRLPARLDIRDQLGSDQYLLFDVCGSSVVSRVSPDYSADLGAQKYVRFDARKVYLFDQNTGDNLIGAGISEAGAGAPATAQGPRLNA